MSMIYVVNEKEDIDVLSVHLRCRKCGNQWYAQIGTDGIIPDSVTNCFRCLAKTSEERARASGREESHG
jgi:hypothetical protein